MESKMRLPRYRNHFWRGEKKGEAFAVRKQDAGAELEL